jgi:VWFA-related protein
MYPSPRSLLALFSLLLAPAALPAQQNLPPSHRITLDVVVAPKSGAPVPGLRQQDFTILDNKASQPVVTFNAISGLQAPIEVVLLVDAVNTNFNSISYERQQIDKFLRAGGGRLPYPTSLAIFTDTGTQVQQQSTRDGNELSAALDRTTIGLRDINRSAGFWGADERLDLSLNALQSLAAKESTRPGRKIILWVSPGWPYLSGPGVELDGKQEQQLFAQVVALSTQFRRAGITLYSVDPLGAGQNVAPEFYYEDFLKGVAKPSQVQLGNLALQVLAVQSGGLALSSGNDIAAHLQQCIADLESYYEISFDGPPTDRPNEYHQLEIKVDKPGLAARTRTGYYSQP